MNPWTPKPGQAIVTNFGRWRRGHHCWHHEVSNEGLSVVDTDLEIAKVPGADHDPLLNDLIEALKTPIPDVNDPVTLASLVDDLPPSWSIVSKTNPDNTYVFYGIRTPLPHRLVTDDTCLTMTHDFPTRAQAIKAAWWKQSCNLEYIPAPPTKKEPTTP